MKKIDINEKLKKDQRLEKSYYPTEYLIRVLIIQKFILFPLSKTNITPNQITIASLIVVVSSFCVIFFKYNLFLAGILYLLYSFLDHCDGMLARYKNIQSRSGKLLDELVDNIAFNGIFLIAYFSSLITFFECFLVVLSLNLHALITSQYIVKKLKKIENLQRFGLKKKLMDMGFILGIDASLLAIFISLGLVFNIFPFICFFLSIIYIVDLVYRFYELYLNLKIDRERKYWSDFYRNNQIPFEPSLFARFCLKKYFMGKKNLLELGCGNGRDALFFANNGIETTALDICLEEINYLKSHYVKNNLQFLYHDFTNFKSIKKYDIVYSRFTLHSINGEQEKNLLPLVYETLRKDGLFCIEARGVKNSLYGLGKVSFDGFIYDGHFRRFLDLDDLRLKLENIGFSILFANEDKGYAPFEEKDDFFIRIVAKK
ncbi:methyltransferase domain-containing protein [Campylobacter lari]|nr:methyltransferase domain-containing protein [Campylobacter lari]